MGRHPAHRPLAERAVRAGDRRERGDRRRTRRCARSAPSTGSPCSTRRSARVVRDGADCRDRRRGRRRRRAARAAHRRSGRRRRHGHRLGRAGDRRVAADRRVRPDREGSRATRCGPARSWSPGRGRFQATAIGAEAYATALAAEAKKFTRVKSELVGGTNTLLRWISVMMLVVGPLVLWSQFRSKDNTQLAGRRHRRGGRAGRHGAGGAGAADEPRVPGRRGLAGPAADARAGTARGRGAGPRRRRVPGQDRHTDPRRHRLRRTARARRLRAGRRRTRPSRCPPTAGRERDGDGAAPRSSRRLELDPVGAMPFSSARKWSAVAADGHGTWVLGAPEMVLPTPRRRGQLAAARAGADAIAAQGRRVLLLAARPGRAQRRATSTPQLPAGPRPAGTGGARRAGARGRRRHVALLRRAGRRAQGDLRGQPAHRRRGRRRGRRAGRPRRQRRGRRAYAARGPRRAGRRARDGPASSAG